MIYPHGHCRESSHASRPSLTSTTTRTRTTICSGIGMRSEHLIRSSHYNGGVTITIAILSFGTSHSRSSQHRRQQQQRSVYLAMLATWSTKRDLTRSRSLLSQCNAFVGTRKALSRSPNRHQLHAYRHFNLTSQTLQNTLLDTLSTDLTNLFRLALLSSLRGTIYA